MSEQPEQFDDEYADSADMAEVAFEYDAAREFDEPE
jgi:hypothetical protein